jgi:hypothetical protein
MISTSRPIQELMDLRHANGIQTEKTYIKYVEFEEALRGADYVSIHVPLLREGEADKPTYHLINETTLKLPCSLYRWRGIFLASGLVFDWL